MTYDDKGIMIPKEVAGSDATYFSDYFYTPGGTGAWVALLRGGNALNWSAEGFGYLETTFTAAGTSWVYVARLAYLPYFKNKESTSQ